MGKAACCASRRPSIQILSTNIKNKIKNNTARSPHVFVTLVLWRTETGKFLRFAGHQSCSPPGFQVKCEPLPRRNKRRVTGTKTLELPSGLGTGIAACLHSNTYHTPWGPGGRQSKLQATCTLLGRSRLFSGGGTHSPGPVDSCRQEI